MSNSNISTEIYIMENTTNYLELNKNYIINMTSVSISTYSPNPEPQKAILILREDSVTTIYGKTKFNLLQNADLSTSIATSANPLFTELNDKTIILYKTSMTLKNFEIYSEYADITSAYTMIKAHDLQEKSVLFTLLEVQISGGMFYTPDPLSMTVSHSHFDAYQSQFIVVIFAACNYPEAVLTGGLYIDTITLFDSLPKAVANTEYFFRYSGPGDLVVDNAYSSVYSFLPATFPIIGIQDIEECIPDVTTMQYGNFSNSYTTLTDNPSGEYHCIMVCAPAFGIGTRPAR